MARYRTWAEWDGLTRDEALSDAERQLADACKAGEPCTLGDGTRPECPSEERTIRAEFLRYLILGGCAAWAVDETGVRLAGAFLTGRLDLAHAKAKGATELQRCCFDEPIIAVQADLSRLDLTGSAIPALDAEGARIKGNVFLCATRTAGKVVFAAAHIGGQLNCEKACFRNKGGYSLYAQGVQVADAVLLRGMVSVGEVSLSGSSIGVEIACQGAVLLNSGRPSLNLQGGRIKGSLRLDGMRAFGELRLSGASFGGQVVCNGMRIRNRKGIALDGHRLDVAGGFNWGKVGVLAGVVAVNSAHVGDLADDLASWPTGGRLILDGFTYDRISGADTDARNRLDWLSRGTLWKGEFFPQPYTQLAKVLREMGHESGAREVLAERDRRVWQHQIARSNERYQAVRTDPDQRADIGKEWLRVRRTVLWNGFLRRVVGYGYKPERALWWSFGTIGLSALIYFLASRSGVMVPNSAVILTSPDWSTAMASNPGAPAHAWQSLPSAAHYETFNALAYAADVFIPLVDLGQRSAWAATTTTWWGTFVWAYSWILILFGWIVTALGAAAITGIIRRE